MPPAWPSAGAYPICECWTFAASSTSVTKCFTAPIYSELSSYSICSSPVLVFMRFCDHAFFFYLCTGCGRDHDWLRKPAHLSELNLGQTADRCCTVFHCCVRATGAALLSVFGIVGLTDTGLATLRYEACANSFSCILSLFLSARRSGVAHSLRTLDVRACCNISCFRDKPTLQAMFPRVNTWQVAI